MKLLKDQLSPGCISCINGSWACVFLNSLCTRRCFYCPQNRSIKVDHKPTVDGVYFEHVEDFLDFLKKFNFRTVAFSGGEPLIAFDLLLVYLRKIREKFGKKMYVWIYTNGDLINERKLRVLKEEGLSEIRFDLGARKYDFTPIILAKKIFGNVVIETPAIPEERKELIRSLVLMHKYGIKRLNLHELIMTDFNREEFVKRGYTFKKNNSVVESERTAFEIYKYILDNKLDIVFNYCTTRYKNHFQGKALNMRYSCYNKTHYETLTRSGHIRQIYLQVNKKTSLFLKKIPFSTKKYVYFDNKNKRLHIYPPFLRETNTKFLDGQKLNIVYYDTLIKNDVGIISDGEKVLRINDKFSVRTYRKICKKIVLTKDIYLYLFAKGILGRLTLVDLIRNSSFRSKFLVKKSLNSYKKRIENLAVFYSFFENVEF